MKKKYIIVGIAAILILLVGAIWIISTRVSQEEDLFKQQEEERIIAQAEETPVIYENAEKLEQIITNNE